jgi:hypothetical protein
MSHLKSTFTPSHSFVGCKYILHLPDCWLEVSIRKFLRPATSAQVFLGFPVSKSECWDGSQDSKLLLHASHVALPPPGDRPFAVKYIITIIIIIIIITNTNTVPAVSQTELNSAPTHRKAEYRCKENHLPVFGSSPVTCYQFL